MLGCEVASSPAAFASPPWQAFLMRTIPSSCCQRRRDWPSTRVSPLCIFPTWRLRIIKELKARTQTIHIVCVLSRHAQLCTMKFKSVCEVFAQLWQKCRNYARDIGEVIRKCGECDHIIVLRMRQFIICIIKVARLGTFCICIIKSSFIMKKNLI